MTDDKLRHGDWCEQTIRPTEHADTDSTFMHNDRCRDSRLAASATDERHSDARHQAGYREDCPACQANDRRIVAASATDEMDTGPERRVGPQFPIPFLDRRVNPGHGSHVARPAASATDEGPIYRPAGTENVILARPAVPAALDVDSRKHIHDLLATVAFLRSVVASGERLTVDDEARMRDVYESAREYAASAPRSRPNDR